MKKLIFTFVCIVLVSLNVNAQYCGNNSLPNPPYGNPSGGSVCTPSGTMTQPGLSPTSDSLPPVINGTITSTVIQFKNFDTITFGGQHLTVQSLRIDSIGNLPAGNCWATNVSGTYPMGSANKFLNQQNGCIKVSGTTCATPGQYRLKILVTANIGVDIATDAAAAGLYYYVRVKNAGDQDTPVDTAGQANNSNIFVPYGPTANCSPTAIKDVSSNINTLNVVPNPLVNKAIVSFYSDKAEQITERLTNLLGSVVLARTLEVRMGENSSVIERNNLPAGVYFYSLSDGKSVATKRVIISE